MKRLLGNAAWLGTWLLILSSLAGSCWGQGLGGFGQDFNPLGGQNPFGPGAGSGDPIVYSASLEGYEGTNTGVLRVIGEVSEGHHTFSLTNPAGGQPTQISVSSSALKLVGSWTSEIDPDIRFDDIFNANVEEHHGTVTWRVDVSWDAGFDPATATDLGAAEVNGQVCTDDLGSCIPVQQTAKIQFTSWVAAPVVGADYVPAGSHVRWSGKVTPATAAPGDTVTLELTATPTDGFYVYGWAKEPTPKGIASETLIALTKTNRWSIEPPSASPEPKSEESGLAEQPVLYKHSEKVTWSLPIQIPADTAVGDYSIEGLIGFQTCSDSTCDLPSAAKFSVKVAVAEAAAEDSASLAFAAHQPAGDAYGSVAEAAKNMVWGAPVADKQAASLDVILYWVGISFLAGLILNVMPCVLPVIGLKIMSLVSQAGSHRLQIFYLNLWLSIGIVFVFMVLGVLAVVFGMAWSDHFTNPLFVVVLTGVVFAFGLSFLGVWEVPIPGFAGSSEANQLAQREGAIGAFFKGVLSTVLATPCAGPMMIPALAFATSQPAAIALGMFASMGLGMASPYLLIGLFPKLIRWLPKPGDWMVTFKEIVGFAMLGTAVFLTSALVDEMRIPMLATAVAIGLACWWVGRIELTASRGQRVTGWIMAIAITVLGGYGSFKLLGPVETELNWTPFDQTLLNAQLKEGKPVFVDFTANWCATCKVNERFALNIAETKALFEEHQIVAMKADKTVPNEAIDRLLIELGNTKLAIPCYAVFVPGRETPVYFDGLITAQTVRDRLAEAGIGVEVGQMAWTEFNRQQLAGTLDQGRSALVVFSATWDATSAAHLRAPFTLGTTQRLFDELDVTPMLADLTTANADAEALLNQLGKPRQVPAYALFVPGRAEPIFFEGLVTEEVLREQMSQLRMLGLVPVSTAAPLPPTL